MPPWGIDGVPTQSRDTSARSRATTGSVVAVSRPLATAVASSSSMPGSTTGLCPERMMLDLHRVDIDATYLVTARSQAGGGDRADISQAEDGDPHLPPQMVGMPISTIVTWVMAEEGGKKQLVRFVRYMRIVVAVTC